MGILTKDLKLQQFTVDEETGEGAYIEVDVDEEITDQGAKEGVKMTSAQGYTSSLNKKGSGIKKGKSSSVGNLLKSSYFTGSGDNVFNSGSVKMSNLNKTEVAKKFEGMDNTWTGVWPASKYEAIYIEPKDKRFPGILLPVDAKYDEDFYKIMDRLGEGLLNNAPYTIQDLIGLFGNQDGWPTDYLNAQLKGTTTKTTDAEEEVEVDGSKYNQK